MIGFYYEIKKFELKEIGKQWYIKNFELGVRYR